MSWIWIIMPRGDGEKDWNCRLYGRRVMSSSRDAVFFDLLHHKKETNPEWVFYTVALGWPVQAVHFNKRILCVVTERCVNNLLCPIVTIYHSISAWGLMGLSCFQQLYSCPHPQWPNALCVFSPKGKSTLHSIQRALNQEQKDLVVDPLRPFTSHPRGLQG